MNKKHFFKPYVGDKYAEGINGKKILVVGASFYCNHIECNFFKQCTDVNRKDSSLYDECCPIYQQDGKQLHDEPSYCIEDGPRTYNIFADSIMELINDAGYETIWSYLAFTNYIQFFLPSRPGKYRETRQSDISERDFEAFNEIMVELQPDIVVIWGCVFNSQLRENNIYLVDKNEEAVI